MIKIFDKLWCIQQRYVPSSYDHKTNKWTYGDVVIKKLSYMTYYQKNSAFKKRCETGVRWAESNRKPLSESDGVIIDNSPQSGFKVVDSVSRWSTSNKLFRIEDPRGFIVEIPTGNLATLLNYVTIKNAVILDDCVWGREGSNHVLLPIGSEPYLESLADAKTLATGLIKPKELKRGDWVTEFESDTQYYFEGRCRLTWQNTRTKEEVTDKWEWLFLSKYDWKNDDPPYYCIVSPRKKIVKVVRNELEDGWLNDTRQYSMPQRVENRFEKGTRHDEDMTSRGYGGYYSRSVSDDFKIVNVEYK